MTILVKSLKTESLEKSGGAPVHRRHHGGDWGTVTPSPQLELATLGKKEAVASDTLPQCTAVLVAVYTGRAVPQP